MTPDQNRDVLRPLENTRVYFSGQPAPTHTQSNTQQLKTLWYLCLRPVEINGRRFNRAPVMHLWIHLPLRVIQASHEHSELRVRGFATVAQYRRADGSLAYGLERAQDLEIQSCPCESWVTVPDAAFVRQRKMFTREVRLPLNTQQSEREGWRENYEAAVKRADQKVRIYRKTLGHVHDAEFRRVITRVQLVLSEGNLPTVEDLNVVYYLIGVWPADHAPRHIRAQFED